MQHNDRNACNMRVGSDAPGCSAWDSLSARSFPSRKVVFYRIDVKITGHGGLEGVDILYELYCHSSTSWPVGGITSDTNRNRKPSLDHIFRDSKRVPRWQCTAQGNNLQPRFSFKQASSKVETTVGGDELALSQTALVNVSWATAFQMSAGAARPLDLNLSCSSFKRSSHTL